MKITQEMVGDGIAARLRNGWVMKKVEWFDDPLYPLTANTETDVGHLSWAVNGRQFRDTEGQYDIVELLTGVPEERTGMTLPTDSAVRKEVPLFTGCLAYFPAALAEVARVSKGGNDKHNPGEPMHHARGKSMDHQDCILRHTVDAADFEAALKRGLKINGLGTEDEIKEAVIYEKAQRAWRDLADLQVTIEEYRGVPMAPHAWFDVNKEVK